MIENPNTKSPHNSAEESEPQDELPLWASWLQQAAAAGTDIVQLLQLELRLAIADSWRLLILALLFVPMLILTWVGFSVLLAWIVYLFNTSITLALLVFCTVQIIGLVGISFGWKHYKKSLTLPLTRQQLRQLVEGVTGEQEQ